LSRDEQVDSHQCPPHPDPGCEAATGEKPLLVEVVVRGIVEAVRRGAVEVVFGEAGRF
jgi:hypothetical protein